MARKAAENAKKKNQKMQMSKIFKRNLHA